MFFSLSISSWTFFHKYDIYTSYMCLFMCKRHLNHCHVKCVENDLNRRKKQNWKTHLKQVQAYFGSQSKSSRFQTSFTRHVVGFSNCAQTFTLLNYLSWDSPFSCIFKKNVEYYSVSQPFLLLGEIWSYYNGKWFSITIFYSEALKSWNLDWVLLWPSI